MSDHKLDGTGVSVHGTGRDVEEGEAKDKPGLANTSSPDEDSERGSQDSTGGLGGIERIRATTQTWTKSWLVATFVFIWLVFFVDSLQQQVSNSLLAYVTSSFSSHGLVATTSVVSTVVAGVAKLPLARLIDVFGRNEGLIIMLVVTVIALILMAACQNVQTYAAAQVFFWTGMNGISYVLQVFLADTTTLKNRMISFGFTNTPYICNTFAGPELAQSFIEGSSWRWGYGAFCVIIPAVCAPIIVIFAVQLRKAKRLGVIKHQGRPEGTSWLQSTRYWLVEMDMMGLLLVIAGFSLLLLPFGLASYQADKWRSGNIIAMLVLGVVCLVALPVYERYIAPKTFIPFELFRNRNVLAACLLGANTWISFYCYKLYFSSYLQVVYNLSVSKAGYITNIFNIVTAFWGVPVGLILRWSGRFKWLGLVSVPIYILFTGLMIKFRMPDTNIGLVVMCEVFTSLAAGTLSVVGQIAAMSAVPHRDVAVTLALVAVVTACGGAVGQSISGAIWTNTVLDGLRRYLPDDLKGNATQIYGDINIQLGYEWGTPAREAIVSAYGDTQKYMLIAASVASVGSMVWVCIMKDGRLSEKEQTKGVVF